MAINKTVGEDAFPSYELDVAGSIGGTTIYENDMPLSTKYATKDYVGGEIAKIVDSEQTYTTFKKVAEYIASDVSGAADMMTNITNNTNAITKEASDRATADNNLAASIEATNTEVAGFKNSYMPKSGGTFTGPIGFTSDSLGNDATNLEYVVGITSYSTGGKAK